ncbi:mannose-1-phosphate guanylyltransferase [PVC group bacterium]|nr:mannose-1-phosphate guanylyltransferase [PVC group bacterium]
MKPKKNKKMPVVAVIMAGGYGERFWPKSRRRRPKQFLDITGRGKSIIRETYERVRKFIPKDQIFVVTHTTQVSLVKQHIPALPQNQILAEPMSRNTAPCVAWAAVECEKRFSDAVMLILPSDHIVINERVFEKDVVVACQQALNSDGLVTFGIPPAYPETGYGYIERGKKVAPLTYQVRQFTEKPGLKRAEKFIRSGKYYWNSGMFVFRASVILDAVKRCDPKLYRAVKTMRQSRGKKVPVGIIQKVYRQCEKKSLDYAVMEKYPHVYLVTARFRWSDIGSWSAVFDLVAKKPDQNVVLGKGQTVIMNSSGCLVSTDSDLVALCGVKDLVVIKEKDALLICQKQSSQNVKNIVLRLNQKKSMKKFL